ncbi:MAG: hypothetical protein HFJ80_06325 [Clostridiales bacterium]|nr:hypothetical protein [Clostridiales bacterium]
MEKFCKFCGKPLAEGESCTCAGAVAAASTAAPAAPQQVPQPPVSNPYAAVTASSNNAVGKELSTAFSNFLPSLKALFVNRSAVLGMADVYVGVLYAAISLICFIVFFLCLAGGVVLSANAVVSSNTIFGAFGKSSLVSYPGGMALLCGIFIFVLHYGCALLTSLICSVAKKEKYEVTKAFTAIGFRSFIPSAVLLLSGIFSLLYLPLGLFFALIAILIFLYDFVSILKASFEDGTNIKYYLALLIFAVAFLIVSWLILKLCAWTFAGMAVGTLGRLF